VHFTILGRVIGSVTGQSWRDFLAKKVLVPAGMTRTTGYASAMYGDKNHAVPTKRNGSTWEPVAQVKTDATMHAAGGLGTSALEGARWLQLHLNDGTLDGKRVLRPETARAMRKLEAKLDKPDGTIRVIEGYGQAWSVGRFNGHALCQHSGGYEGASSYMGFLPDDHVGVLVLINAAGIAQGLRDIVAVETMERLTGTKSPWDVYERLTARARQEKEKQAAQEETPELVQASNPSSHASEYTGTFSNEWLGTLRLDNGSGELSMLLGSMRLEFERAEASSDGFELHELMEAKTPGRFVRDDRGGIQAVTLQHPRYGEIVFRR